MFADYIYEIYKKTREVKAPDLLIGMAHLETEKPIPEGVDATELRQFLGRHGARLSRAFNKTHAEYFSDFVYEILDEENEEAEV